MKSLFRFLMVVLIVGPLGLRAASPTNWNAVVQKSDGILISYGLPGKMVQVTFPKPYPTNLVKSVTSYTLFKSSDPTQVIPLQGVNLGGNLQGGTVDNVSRAFLLPKTELTAPDSKSTYMVKIQFGTVSSGDIPVAWPTNEEAAPAAPPSGSELVNLINVSSNLFSGSVHLTVDSRVPTEASHAPAFDFDLKYDLLNRPLRSADDTNFNHMWIASANLDIDGTYKIDNHDTNVADHLDFSANFDLMYLYRLPDPLTQVDPTTRQHEGKLAYYAGFRLEGFDLEADQNFNIMNYVVQPQLALWIPYSNIPALWWTRNVGVTGNAATPLYVYAGYALVNTLHSDSTLVSPTLQKDDRFELEMAYAFPLTSRIRFGVRSRFFWLLDEGLQRNYQEVYARYYLNDKDTTALLFKYTHGSVPPKFEQGDSVGAGFTIQF